MQVMYLSRIPYYIIILVGLITLFFSKIIKLTSFLLIFLLLAEFLVSNYHTLSTYEVISSGCQSAEIPNDINQLKEALMSDTLIVNCSNANLKYFGIPLSIYNSFFHLCF